MTKLDKKLIKASALVQEVYDKLNDSEDLGDTTPLTLLECVNNLIECSRGHLP